MGRVEVKLNLRGINAALNDPKVVADLERRGNAIAAEANSKARSVWPSCREDPCLAVTHKHKHIPVVHVLVKAASRDPKAKGCAFLERKYGVLSSSINAGR